MMSTIYICEYQQSKSYNWLNLFIKGNFLMQKHSFMKGNPKSSNQGSHNKGQSCQQRQYIFGENGMIENAMKNLKQSFQQTFTTNNSSKAFLSSNYSAEINCKNSPLKNKKINITSTTLSTKTQKSLSSTISKPNSAIPTTKSQAKIKWACLKPRLNPTNYIKCTTEENINQIFYEDKNGILNKIGKENSSGISKIQTQLFLTIVQNQRSNFQNEESYLNLCIDKEAISLNPPKGDKKLCHTIKRDIRTQTLGDLKIQVQSQKNQYKNCPWILLQREKKTKQTSKIKLLNQNSPINKLLQLDLDNASKFFK